MKRMVTDIFTHNPGATPVMRPTHLKTARKRRRIRNKRLRHLKATRKKWKIQ